MAKKAYDLVVKTGTYEKNGETKARYQNVGAVLQKDDGGKFILLDRLFNPAGVPNPDGKDTVIISLYEPKGDKQPDTHKGFDKQGDVSSTLEGESIPF